MKLFVTGGTGFIGSHFLRTALSAGHGVVALRRSSASQPRIALPMQPQWLDKEMPAVVGEDFAGCDAVVHLAAVGVSPQRATWDELFRINVVESLGLCMAAAEAGVRRFVICGSCFEYGRSSERYDFIPPDAPLEPVNGYGASKAAASIALLTLARERSLELALLRPFQAFGEGQHESNFWPSLRAAALEGRDFPMTAGEQIRDYQPVEDLAAGFLEAAVNASLVPGEPLVRNVGSGCAQTLAEFAEHWWREWNATGRLLKGAVPYRAGEVMRYIPKI
ncbi:MAG TPA: NAD(P)-dependent oxidoreductase [Chthoniobacterales bacterium]